MDIDNTSNKEENSEQRNIVKVSVEIDNEYSVDINDTGLTLYKNMLSNKTNKNYKKTMGYYSDSTPGWKYIFDAIIRDRTRHNLKDSNTYKEYITELIKVSKELEPTIIEIFNDNIKIKKVKE